LLETLVEFGLTDDWQHMIDSPTERGHSQAAGAKGGPVRRLLVDHAVALRAKSTPAQTVRPPSWLCPDRWASLRLHCCSGPFGSASQQTRLFLADKGYDADAVREELLIRGIQPVIPPKANRKNPPVCDFKAYKDRNRIERMFRIANLTYLLVGWVAVRSIRGLFLAGGKRAIGNPRSYWVWPSAAVVAPI
jgi:transposase